MNDDTIPRGPRAIAGIHTASGRLVELLDDGTFRLEGTAIGKSTAVLEVLQALLRLDPVRSVGTLVEDLRGLYPLLDVEEVRRSEDRLQELRREAGRIGLLYGRPVVVNPFEPPPFPHLPNLILPPRQRHLPPVPRQVRASPAKRRARKRERKARKEGRRRRQR